MCRPSWKINETLITLAVGDVYNHPDMTMKHSSPNVTPVSGASYMFATSALIQQLTAIKSSAEALVEIRESFLELLLFRRTFLSVINKCKPETTVHRNTAIELKLFYMF